MTATLIATPPVLEGVRAAGFRPGAPVIGAGVAGAPPQGVAAAPVLVPNRIAVR